MTANCYCICLKGECRNVGLFNSWQKCVWSLKLRKWQLYKLYSMSICFFTIHILVHCYCKNICFVTGSVCSIGSHGCHSSRVRTRPKLNGRSKVLPQLSLLFLCHWHYYFWTVLNTLNIVCKTKNVIAVVILREIGSERVDLVVVVEGAKHGKWRLIFMKRHTCGECNVWTPVELVFIFYICSSTVVAFAPIVPG